LVLFLKYDKRGSICIFLSFDVCAPNSGEGRVQRAQQHIVTADSAVTPIRRRFAVDRLPTPWAAFCSSSVTSAPSAPAPPLL
jgi:hypothetical protein